MVGESQILGQVRQALSVAREHATLSRGLGELGTLALRTARRAHAETRIDQAGANLVSIGIAVAHGRLAAGPRRTGRQGQATPVPGSGPRRSGQAARQAGGSPAARRAAGAGRRGRLDELAGRHHRGPDGRGAHRGGQPHRRPGRAAGRVGRRHRADLPDLAGRSPRLTWSSPAPAPRAW